MPINAHPFRLDATKGAVFPDDKVVALSPKPFRFCEMLLEKEGGLVSFAECSVRIWPESPKDDPEHVRRKVNRLAYAIKKKFGEAGECIKPVHRCGYYLELGPRGHVAHSLEASASQGHEGREGGQKAHEHDALSHQESNLVEPRLVVSLDIPWRISQSIFVPIAKEDFDIQTGGLDLTQVEIPNLALDQLLSGRPELVMPQEIREFLHDVWTQPRKYHSILADHPAAKAWVETIWATPSNGSRKFVREQLLKFLRAMQGSGIVEELLPDFYIDEINSWRIFVQAFPESIGLLEAASKIKFKSQTKLMAVAALSATAARQKDMCRVSSRAAAITRQLMESEACSTVRNFERFRVVRHLIYAAVEAGECPPERFLDFVTHSKQTIDWELEMNRRYYKSDTDAPLTLTVVRKWERPRNRDEHTQKITAFHLEALPRDLVDQAYHKMR